MAKIFQCDTSLPRGASLQRGASLPRPGVNSKTNSLAVNNFFFRNQIFLICSFTHIYPSVAACLPSPAPTPGWRRRRPATPSLRRRRDLLLLVTHSPRQSFPSHPHHQVPPDTTKATLILVKMAINPIKSIAGFPTTKPLYPNIPGK